MQFFSIIAAICFTSTAMACANGPYKTNSACAGTCVGAQRCGDNNWIVGASFSDDCDEL